MDYFYSDSGKRRGAILWQDHRHLINIEIFRVCLSYLISNAFFICLSLQEFTLIVFLGITHNYTICKNPQSTALVLENVCVIKVTFTYYIYLGTGMDRS